MNNLYQPKENENNSSDITGRNTKGKQQLIVPFNISVKIGRGVKNRMKNKGTYNYCKSSSPVLFIKTDKYFF